MKDEIEQMIQDKGLDAPRVTPERIDQVIAHEHYFTAHEGIQGAELEHRRASAGMPVSCNPITKHELEMAKKSSLSRLTICVLVLVNGFTVIGESACASPENFDAEVGRKAAKRNAMNKIWPLEGYLLTEQLHQEAERRKLVDGLGEFEDDCGGACKI